LWRAGFSPQTMPSPQFRTSIFNLCKVITLKLLI
jgi:hypothetical protein